MPNYGLIRIKRFISYETVIVLYCIISYFFNCIECSVHVFKECDGYFFLNQTGRLIIIIIKRQNPSAESNPRWSWSRSRRRRPARVSGALSEGASVAGLDSAHCGFRPLPPAGTTTAPRSTQITRPRGRCSSATSRPSLPEPV